MRFVLLFLAACVSTTPQPVYVQGAPGSQPAASTADPNSGTVECHDESITGSLISHQVCRTKETTDEKRGDTMLRQLEGPKPPAPCCQK